MEVKWPFLLLVFGLIFGLGLTIATLQRNSIMNNWASRRCELPVMMAAIFLKPISDPRTSSDFAKDNFDFCIKSFIDRFMELLLAPINALFGKQTTLGTGASGALNTIRNIASTLYNTLLSYLDQYFRRFNAAVYEMSRITQYLRMAMRRANAVVMSLLYSGLTIFKGMINTIQFVVKVVMIIVGILLAIIIILIFVLFPVIPLILAVLGAIVGTVLSLSLYMSSTIAQQAENSKGGFCFSESTLITVLDENNSEQNKLVSQIKIGDKLAKNCGTVTAIIKMVGSDVSLYDIEGILVSGTHLVKGTDNIWKSVLEDERAKLTTIKSDILYCFNTTSRQIPVFSNNQNNIILFRDWEELADDDTFGNISWIYNVLLNLNKNKDVNTSTWWKTIKLQNNIPLLSFNTKVKTKNGFIEISKLDINDNILEINGKEQKVLGKIIGEVKDVKNEGNEWNTALIEYQNNEWLLGKERLICGTDILEGMTFITESGEFIIWDEIHKKEKCIRDFTDIGYKKIHETYEFVAHRLRVIN